jgi:hypothetical protein
VKFFVFHEIEMALDVRQSRRFVRTCAKTVIGWDERSDNVLEMTANTRSSSCDLIKLAIANMKKKRNNLLASSSDRKACINLSHPQTHVAMPPSPRHTVVLYLEKHY